MHMPLLKGAPRKDGAYEILEDELGDLVHFYGDFSGFHIYLIVTTYKKEIVPESLRYYDPLNGMFSVTLSVMDDDGNRKLIPLEKCQAPIFQNTAEGAVFPQKITVEKFSVGTPDGLKFHFAKGAPKFRFSNNLTPHVSELARFSNDGYFDLQVEYVGKAVGDDGSREVSDRFEDGHSTETKILRELNHKRTNRDGYAILYKPGRLIDVDGTLSSSISYSHIVDVMERAITSYFQPEKNKTNKKFPDDRSDGALRLRKAGVDYLFIEIESPSKYGMLYTFDAARDLIHRCEMEIPQ